VTPPTAAILRPENARASRPELLELLAHALTALTEVNPIHS
jgi:hypothetical protein